MIYVMFLFLICLNFWMYYRWALLWVLLVCVVKCSCVLCVWILLCVYCVVMLIFVWLSWMLVIMMLFYWLVLDYSVWILFIVFDMCLFWSRFCLLLVKVCWV